MSEEKKGSSIRVKTPFGFFQLESTQLTEDFFAKYKPLFEKVDNEAEYERLKNEIFREVGLEPEKENKEIHNPFWEFLEEVGFGKAFPLFEKAETNERKPFSTPTNIMDLIFGLSPLSVNDIDEHIELLNKMKEEILQKDKEKMKLEERQKLLLTLEEHKTQYEYLKNELLSDLEDQEKMNAVRIKMLSVKKEIDLITKKLEEDLNV